MRDTPKTRGMNSEVHRLVAAALYHGGVRPLQRLPRTFRPPLRGSHRFVLAAALLFNHPKGAPAPGVLIDLLLVLRRVSHPQSSPLLGRPSLSSNILVSMCLTTAQHGCAVRSAAGLFTRSSRGEWKTCWASRWGTSNANAMGASGISKELHSKRHKAHTHTGSDRKPKCVPRGNADQHWCSLPAQLASELAVAKA